MLARLHELGAISTFFERYQRQELTKQVQAGGKNAVMDIYNYAARFDGTPKCDIQLGGRHSGKTSGGLVVTFEFSEQNIRVTGRGRDFKSASLSASLQFKEQAEKYQAARGEGSIIIKDSTSLTTTNCRDFFQFYKIIHRRAVVTADVTTKPDMKRVGYTPYCAQVKINGSPVGEPVEIPARADAETLAFLTAAVALKKQDPTLFPQFVLALRAGNGSILRPIHATEMPVDEDCIAMMHQTMETARNGGLSDEVVQLETDETVADRPRLPRNLLPLKPRQAEMRNTQLQKTWSAYMCDPDLEKLRRLRNELPMNQYRGEVLDLVNNNQYSIIVGTTGSGKTTQVPQILFEDAIAKGEGSACNIICTQPRRIAATSVAQRVAEERNEELRETVGYHIRFDSQVPVNRGSITYCTTGILATQLQYHADAIMDAVSHIVIDEVHERGITEDFLLIVLKKIIHKRIALGRPCPKIVLMSATMNTELFASYFSTNVGGDGAKDCPSLTVPGRTFPVKELYLDSILENLRLTHHASLSLLHEDFPTYGYLQANARFCQEQSATGLANTGGDGPQSDEFVIDWKQERKISAEGEIIMMNNRDDALVPIGLVGLTVAHIAKTSEEGALLVFLPGLDDLIKVENLLRGGRFGIDFCDESKFRIYKLHSSLKTGQTEVFDTVPEGCRKIILATNIAETSITIPDVRYVVDTGKVKSNQYDSSRRITHFACTWISKSNSKQRAGRAGRVQNGNYYALFPRARYNWMRAVASSELLRMDLQETCLQIKRQAFKSPIREFLAEAIEPPPPNAVDIAVMKLQDLEALTPDENLTSLGRLLGLLPVHPALGKVIVLGIIFRCLDPMLTLGAALQEGSLFVAPAEVRKQARVAKLAFVQETGSDHIATINAVISMRYQAVRYGQHAAYHYAKNNFINYSVYKKIDTTAVEVEGILVQAGLIRFTRPSARKGCQLGDPLLNENSDKVPLIKALAVAAFHPNLAKNIAGRFFRTSGEDKTIIHQSSVNAASHERKESKESKYDRESSRTPSLYTYSSLSRASDGYGLFLRDTTECTPLMAALFGGRITNPHSNLLVVDGWLPWKVESFDNRAVQTIIKFRNALERIMANAFRDLAVQQQTPKQYDGQRTFLADEAVRSAFAKGLVEVLDHDVLTRDAQDPIDPWSYLGPIGNDRTPTRMENDAHQGSENHFYPRRNFSKDMYRDLWWSGGTPKASLHDRT